MACKTQCAQKLFINTTIVIKLALKQGIVYSWHELQDLIVTLTLRNSAPVIKHSFSINTGEIQTIGNITYLRIPDTAITVPGLYDIRGVLVSPTGDRLGITICPSPLKFE